MNAKGTSVASAGFTWTMPFQEGSYTFTLVGRANCDARGAPPAWGRDERTPPFRSLVPHAALAASSFCHAGGFLIFSFFNSINPPSPAGFATAYTCSSGNTAITLTTAGGAQAKFTLDAPTGTDAINNQLTISAAGRATCTTKVLQPESAQCNKTKVLFAVSAAAKDRWIVEPAPTAGQFYIRSVVSCRVARRECGQVG